MRELIISWLMLSLTVWLTSLVLPGWKTQGATGALVAGALFGGLHWLIGRLLFVVIGIGTLGLAFLLAFITRWLVDAIVLKMVDGMTRRLEIKSFGWAFLGAMVMSGLGTLLEYLLRPGPTEIRL